MNDKSVNISYSNGKLNVAFKGIWRRSDVDNAYRAMLMELPRHLLITLKRMEEKDGTEEKRQ